MLSMHIVDICTYILACINTCSHRFHFLGIDGLLHRKFMFQKCLKTDIYCICYLWVWVGVQVCVCFGRCMSTCGSIYGCVCVCVCVFVCCSTWGFLFLGILMQI